MCGGRSSILHYGPLIVTNNLYDNFIDESGALVNIIDNNSVCE